MNEIYHYPYLCVGWFGLFITAMNLIPVGQLDGGHIMYALVGSKQGVIARIFWGILIAIGLLGIAPLLGMHIELGTVGWLLLAGILFFLIKLDHPKVYDDYSLNANRKILGWSSFIIFILIFPPVPFYELPIK